ncbi:MAG: ribosome biogenesis factor YjgA [Steroidobacteraceae bacterium]
MRATDADEPLHEEPPSKSARKRAAHAAQDLGETLITLRERDLETLDLPGTLLDALRAARAIRSRAALARQRQYIGKLMRQIDPEPIRRALASRSERDAEETERFKRAEHWRARLLEEGDAALAALEAVRPDLDRAHWQRLLRAARTEQPSGAATQGPAGRALFRALRGLLG